MDGPGDYIADSTEGLGECENAPRSVNRIIAEQARRLNGAGLVASAYCHEPSTPPPR